MVKISDYLTTTETDPTADAVCVMCGEQETIRIPRFEAVGYPVPPSLFEEGWGIIRILVERGRDGNEGDALLLCPACMKKARVALGLFRELVDDREDQHQEDR